MEQHTLMFGRADALQIALIWRNGYGTKGPVGRTWGDLALWIRGVIVWGRRDSCGNVERMTWSWIDLLEFLGNAWPYLERDEDLPIAFEWMTGGPVRLCDLREYAARRWTQLPDDDADEEDRRLRDFLVVHDLAESLDGACPPQLLLLRKSHYMRVATHDTDWLLPYDEVMHALETLGDAIYDRIAVLTDDRSVIARDRWSTRYARPIPPTPSGADHEKAANAGTAGENTPPAAGENKGD